MVIDDLNFSTKTKYIPTGKGKILFTTRDSRVLVDPRFAVPRDAEIEVSKMNWDEASRIYESPEMANHPMKTIPKLRLGLNETTRHTKPSSIYSDVDTALSQSSAYKTASCPKKKSYLVGDTASSQSPVYSIPPKVLRILGLKIAGTLIAHASFHNIISKLARPYSESHLDAMLSQILKEYTHKSANNLDTDMPLHHELIRPVSYEIVRIIRELSCHWHEGVQSHDELPPRMLDIYMNDVLKIREEVLRALLSRSRGSTHIHEYDDDRKEDLGFDESQMNLLPQEMIDRLTLLFTQWSAFDILLEKLLEKLPLIENPHDQDLNPQEVLDKHIGCTSDMVEPKCGCSVSLDHSTWLFITNYGIVHFTPSMEVPPPGYVDKLKMRIESILKAPINWWPMSDVWGYCLPGHIRVHWACVS